MEFLLTPMIWCAHERVSAKACQSIDLSAKACQSIDLSYPYLRHKLPSTLSLCGRGRCGMRRTEPSL